MTPKLLIEGAKDEFDLLKMAAEMMILNEVADVSIYEDFHLD